MNPQKATCPRIEIAWILFVGVLAWPLAFVESHFHGGYHENRRDPSPPFPSPERTIGLEYDAAMRQIDRGRAEAAMRFPHDRFRGRGRDPPELPAATGYGQGTFGFPTDDLRYDSNPGKIEIAEREREIIYENGYGGKRYFELPKLAPVKRGGNRDDGYFNNARLTANEESNYGKWKGARGDHRESTEKGSTTGRRRSGNDPDAFSRPSTHKKALTVYDEEGKTAENEYRRPAKEGETSEYAGNAPVDRQPVNEQSMRLVDNDKVRESASGGITGNGSEKSKIGASYSIGSRNIIVAPSLCVPGERRDSAGRCREIFD